ncbi:TerB family tellurite resistance protein [Pseudooceanicola sp.]|uniref:tellurite resistance TerB family protein n=1 Tax=Pseudooceanicola sp. TaxID=1914328 RepID=UPI0026160D7B|nr:TerB family tellurite resistance protein [Pseudooceanicola sp.]MDF1853894.1 TerB family tellurite resistance protein [Pseudooceanicola sp.]
MFADLLSRLIRPDPAPLPDADARLALTALLVRAARSDGHYDNGEQARISRILANRYHLSAAEALELRQNGEVLEVEAPDTVRFTRAIKDAVPLEDRIAVVEALWAVVLEDGTRNDAENALMRLVANLLGITDQDSNAARRRVTPG